VTLVEVTMEVPVIEGASAGQEAHTDEAALAELQPLVVRTVRLVVGSGSSVAEDAAQEALLELSRALPRLRTKSAAPAYAARIAARVAVRAAKRERRFALLGLRARESRASVPEGPPSELVELKDAFDRLPPGQRATAVLRLYVGLSEQETAAALRCSVGTVKHQLHDARIALASYLDRGSAATPRKRGEA
jgi:RNA polymerase sigma factor (sigma-70 family)